jgi:sodium transport system permease protein
MITPLRRTWIVFRKEVLDNLRDRRSVMSSLISTLFIPVFLIAMIMVMGRTIMSDMTDRPLDLPVSGVEHAPGLIAFLKENNVNILPAPDDPHAAVREGEVQVVLVIFPEYGEAFRQGEPARLQIVQDNTRQSSMPHIQRTRALISAYGQTISSLRLLARGVSPKALQVLSIEQADVSTPQSRALIFMSMLPFMLVMTIFVGGMYVIIDTTAGERERGSLEPLLINPVMRREFVMGKLLASLPFAAGGLALSLILFGIGFNVIPMENYVGTQLNIDNQVLLNIFLLSLPMVLLASAMQMVVASFTRSFKEAQTYLPLLPLFAGLPSAFLAFVSVRPTALVASIPIFSQSILINQMMRGETILRNNLVISSVATIAAAILFILLAIYLYQRETILFGGK